MTPRKNGCLPRFSSRAAMTASAPSPMSAVRPQTSVVGAAVNPSARSIAPAGIGRIEHALIGRPVGRAAAGIVMLVLMRGLLANLGGDFDQRAAGRFHAQL